MSQFIESIKYEEGQIFHLKWHQDRVNKTFAKFYPSHPPINLSEVIDVPNLKEKHKIRIEYNTVVTQLEFIEYQPKGVKGIEFIPITFSYAFKFKDRERINALQGQSSSDEVIFTKENQLLDSSYSNVAFFDGNEWFTPTTYLLNGTTRQRLIFENKLKEIPIQIKDLPHFEKVSFINAMNDLDEHILLL